MLSFYNGQFKGFGTFTKINAVKDKRFIKLLWLLAQQP